MDAIFSFLQDFDMTKLLPEPEKYLRSLEGWTRFGLLLCPLLLLAVGLLFRYRPPESADQILSIRTDWSTGSHHAWQVTHRIAGLRLTFFGGIMAAAVLVISLFFRLFGTEAMMTIALILVIAELVVILLVFRMIRREVEKNCKGKK